MKKNRMCKKALGTFLAAAVAVSGMSVTCLGADVAAEEGRCV